MALHNALQPQLLFKRRSFIIHIFIQQQSDSMHKKHRGRAALASRIASSPLETY